MSEDAIRDHLVRVLDWEEAHVGFDKAIDGIPADKRGVKAPGFEYSVGLGVRYNIAVARFGIDVAQPLSEPGRSPKFHLYISTQF